MPTTRSQSGRRRPAHLNTDTTGAMLRSATASTPPVADLERSAAATSRDESAPSTGDPTLAPVDDRAIAAGVVPPLTPASVSPYAATILVPRLDERLENRARATIAESNRLSASPRRILGTTLPAVRQCEGASTPTEAPPRVDTDRRSGKASSRRSTRSIRLAQAQEELLQLKIKQAENRIALIEAESDSDDGTVSSVHESQQRVTEWLNDAQPLLNFEEQSKQQTVTEAQANVTPEPQQYRGATIQQASTEKVFAPIITEAAGVQQQACDVQLHAKQIEDRVAQLKYQVDEIHQQALNIQQRATYQLPAGAYSLPAPQPPTLVPPPLPQLQTQMHPPQQSLMYPGPAPATANSQTATRGQQLDVTELASAIMFAARTGQPPRMFAELPFFSGAYQEWLSYKAAYIETAPSYSDVENLTRLRKSLKGRAKEAVETLLMYSTKPEEIIRTLESRFGRPDSIAMAELDLLRCLPRPTDTARELCVFATKVTNIVTTLRALNREYYLHNPEVTKATIEKLTPAMRYRWFDYAAEQKPEEPDLIKLARFLEREATRCAPYAQPESIGQQDRTETVNRRPQQYNRTYTANIVSKKFKSDPKTEQPSCSACNKPGHSIKECQTFTGTDADGRWDIAKLRSLCFRCLRYRTVKHSCPGKPCGTEGCTRLHHPLLHFRKKEEDKPEAEVITSTWVPQQTCAYLKIVRVRVSGPRCHVDTYALLDDGSTVTLIDEEIAQKVGAEGPVQPLNIVAIGKTEIPETHSKRVTLTLTGTGQFTDNRVEARTIKSLKLSPQSVTEKEIEGCPHLVDISEDLKYPNAKPKVLIGQDNWHLLMAIETRKGKRNQPVASKTPLGWVLHGATTRSLGSQITVNHIVSTEERLDEDLKRYFALESLMINPKNPRNDPEQRALDLLEKHTVQLQNGHYETALLWKTESNEMPNNRQNAISRLQSVEKKLEKNPELKAKYEAQMQALIQNNYAEEAPDTVQPGRTWYLPHFPVVNVLKPGKIRIVHDAAAKTKGVSLNDHLLTGPDLLQSLPGVLMRFRQNPVVVTADIREMFMQVKIRKEDRDALRYLWRDQDRRQEPPKEYRMSSLIFGATSSPATAIFVKNANAEKHKKSSPEAYNAIVRCHYVDDYLQSFSTEEEAIYTATEVREIQMKARYELRQWRSNSLTVLKALGEEKQNVKQKPERYLNLETDILNEAERMIISASQSKFFKQDIQNLSIGRPVDKNSRLRSLAVEIVDGLLRLKPRINKADNITEDMKNPIILDGNDQATRLYIDYIHRKLNHSGVEIVVNECKQKFVVLRLRPTTKTVLSRCLFCKIRKSQPTGPPAGNHPHTRLAHHQRPFTFVGVDYFGPLTVTVGRTVQKRYVALFTCLTTRAVPLEMATSLSTDSAIMALRRLIARRGCPTEIWSDNGTNLQGADKELRRAIDEATVQEASLRRIQWKFIPPSAPFMGGAWERLVRSVKTALHSTLNERSPSEEVLITLLAEAECVVNSRPLTHVSVDPNDPEALTPNHFLLGGSASSTAPGTFTDRDFIGRTYWRASQRLADKFWTRWVREYLPDLQYRREPQGRGRPIKIGDVVLIADGNLPRNTWPRGLIIEVFPGPDGVIRTVDVRTKAGVLRRPVKKLVILSTEPSVLTTEKDATTASTHGGSDVQDRQ